MPHAPGRLFAVCLALVLGWGAVAHAAAAVPPGWDPTRFISTAEVGPGTRGTGRTVFSGTKIETFDVEIIGVLYDFAPGRDAVIARLSGHPTIDTAGVIQGMSGSPVYVDGRLLGAVAFGWSFMSEPVCGITPIQHMLPMMDKEGGTPQDMQLASGGGVEPIRLTPAQVESLPGFPVTGAAQLEPLATPIMVSGVSAEFLEEIRPWFEPLGLVPVAGAGLAAEYRDVNPALEPGAALAVPLIEGDIQATAVGTVTYAADGNVVGFGHAFRYAGAVALPMGNAFVVGVLPSQMVSRKLAVGLRTLGALRQDQQTGIAGRLGAAPAMVPLTVSVKGPGVGAAHTYSFGAAPDRNMLPVLMGMAGSGAVSEMVQEGAPFRAQLDLTVRPRGYPPITGRHYLSSHGGMARPVGTSVVQYVQALLNNPYGRLALDGVDVQVTVEAGLGQAYLEEVRPRYLRVRPGEALPVTVVYRMHEGERMEAEATLQIPESARDGMHMLIVSDAARTVALDQRRAPMRYRPTTLEQYLDVLDLDFPQNELTFTLLSPRTGMAVHGEELSDLPGSVVDVMRTAARRDLAQPTQGTVVAQTTVALDAVVTGAAIMTLTVDRHAP